MALICFDLSDGASFNSVESRFYLIKNFNERCKISLVGTKADLKRAIPTENAIRLAATLGVEYYETSAKSESNYEEILSEIIRKA